ncbi:MAG: hypothetical protein HYZ75_19620 [Elusimicrobia bacterium]|nr:hypothetical protein [Elusimicrobiota bacterium]
MAELPPDRPIPPPPPPGKRAVPPPPGMSSRPAPQEPPAAKEPPQSAPAPQAGYPAGWPPGMPMPWMQAPWQGMPPGMPAYPPAQPSWAPPPAPPVQAGMPQPPAPPSGASDADRRVAELERRLQAEREKVLLANLKSQEEKVVAARVETSIKEVQEKLRTQRRESEHEESRLKLEGRVQELENRLVQERETWVSTLRTQVGQREAQDKEIESHLTSRLQEMERRWLEEKAHWQRVITAKEDELRKAKEAAAERDEARHAVKSMDQELKASESKAAELLRVKNELEARIGSVHEKEREYFAVKAEFEKARDQARHLQERYDRDIQSARLSSKEREDRLQADCERLQNDLLTVTQRLRLQHDAEIQQVKTHAEGKVNAAQEEAALEVRAIAARHEAASRKLKDEQTVELERSRAQADQAQGALARMRAVCAALERQAGAMRTGALEGRKAKEEATRQLERYKGEFLVLQRKWQDREAELRAQLGAEAGKQMDAERSKLKLRAQEEVQARVLRVQQQLRAELEVEYAEKERLLRATAEKALAEKAREVEAEAAQARRLLEAELDRRTEEGRGKEARIHELLAQRDAELAALRSQSDESRGRLTREEKAREEDRAARLAFEKELISEKARLTVLQGSLEEARQRALRDEERQRAVTAERDTIMRERAAAEGKGASLSRELEAARTILAEAADVKARLEAALDESRAEAKKLEEKRRSDEEVAKRKLEILRREAEARASALEAERDAALAAAAAGRREADERVRELEVQLSPPEGAGGMKGAISKLFGKKDPGDLPPPPGTL